MMASSLWSAAAPLRLRPLINRIGQRIGITSSSPKSKTLILFFSSSSSNPKPPLREFCYFPLSAEPMAEIKYNFVPTGRFLANGYKCEEKDLESEDALRDLYERWLAHFRLQRPIPSEAEKRFQFFKKNARLVHEHNERVNAIPYEPGVTPFSDSFTRGLSLLSDSDKKQGYPFDWERAPISPPPRKKVLDPAEKAKNIYCSKADLESNERLWSLYERWLSRYNLSRSPSEKRVRFEHFKERARMLHQYPWRHGNKNVNKNVKIMMDELSDCDKFERGRLILQMSNQEVSPKAGAVYS